MSASLPRWNTSERSHRVSSGEAGKNPLFHAIKSTDDRALCTLMEDGADPEEYDELGWSPLHAAASSGKWDLFWKLLKVKVQKAQNKTEEDQAEDTSKASEKEKKKSLLSSSKASDSAPRKRDSSSLQSSSPLHYLCKHGEITTSKEKKTLSLFLKCFTVLLFRFPWMLDHSNEKGETPLHYASFGKGLLPLQLLILNGAKVNVLSHIRQVTPLSMAMQSKQVEKVRILLENGADLSIDSPDNLLKTSLEKADLEMKLCVRGCFLSESAKLSQHTKEDKRAEKIELSGSREVVNLLEELRTQMAEFSSQAPEVVEAPEWTASKNMLSSFITSLSDYSDPETFMQDHSKWDLNKIILVQAHARRWLAFSKYNLRKEILDNLSAPELTSKLEILVEYFLIPFQANVPKVLTRDQTFSLFSNIEAILKFHQTIAAEVQQMKALSPIKIASIFGSYVLRIATEFGTLYSSYFQNLENSKKTFQKLSGSPNFNELLNLCEEKSKCMLVDLLTLPVQNILIWVMEFQRVLLAVPKRNLSHEGVKIANDNIQQIVSNLKVLKQQAENKAKVKRIQKVVLKNKLKISKADRELVREGVVNKVKTSGQSAFFLFLFNDVLILVDNVHTLVREYLVPLSDVKVYDLPDIDDFKHCFQLVFSSVAPVPGKQSITKCLYKSFTFNVLSLDEKKIWLRDLNEQINGYKELVITKKATDTESVDELSNQSFEEGWVIKSSSQNSRWVERYFVLKHAYLYYYAPGVIQGTFQIKNVKIQHNSYPIKMNYTDPGYPLTLIFPDNQLNLATRSEKELLEWVNFFHEVDTLTVKTDTPSVRKTGNLFIQTANEWKLVYLSVKDKEAQYFERYEKGKFSLKNCTVEINEQVDSNRVVFSFITITSKERGQILNLRLNSKYELARWLNAIELQVDSASQSSLADDVVTFVHQIKDILRNSPRCNPRPGIGKLRADKNRPLHILSIDGGGLRGLLVCILLERLLDWFPNLIDEVDLIAGTSNGAMIAMGLAFGHSPTTCRTLLEVNGKHVFVKKSSTSLNGAKYSNRFLKIFCDEVYGYTTKLKEAHKYLCVPAFLLDNAKEDARSVEPKLFTNLSQEDPAGEEGCSDVVMRTTAAPTYFPSYQGYSDGGLFAHDPSWSALTLAMSNKWLGEKPNQIVLLSLGTGKTNHYYPNKNSENHDWGYVQWVPKLPSVLWDGMVEKAEKLCHVVLGRRYHKLNPILPCDLPLDDATGIPTLAEVAKNVDLKDTIAWLRENW